MPVEAKVLIAIGAAVSSTVGAAFAGASSAIKKLGSLSDELSNKQRKMGEVMARSIADPTIKVTGLRQEYDKLGKTIEEVGRKQQRLSELTARAADLSKARAETWGKMKETAAFGAAVGAPVIQSVRVAAAFEDVVKDIAITGELTRKEELELGKAIRGLATQYNQSQADLGESMKRLVETGMKIGDANALMPLMAKTATATRTDSGDAAKMARSFQLLGIDNAKDMELAFNQAAKAGKQGSFELRDMAKWFPALGGMMKAIGVQGNEAVVSMAARMQVATRTAGSNDEAANNFKNFLSKLTSQDAIKDFKKQDIDLIPELQAAARRGVDPIAAGVDMVMNHVKTKAPEAAAELKKVAEEVAKITDPAQRQAEVERRMGMIQQLGERAGIGDLFQDIQAVSYLLAEMQNKGDLNTLMGDVKTGQNAQGKGVIDADFQHRMEGAQEQFKAFKIALTDIGISIGDTLLPPITDFIKMLAPMMRGISDWAKEHPGLIRGIAMLVGGLVAGKLAVLGVSWAFNFLFLSPLNAIKTVGTLIGAIRTMGTAASQLGVFSRAWQAVTGVFGRVASAATMVGRLLGGYLLTSLRVIGGGLATAGSWAMWLGRMIGGALMSGLRIAGSVLGTVAQGAMWLGRILGGALLNGLRLAGQAVLFLGRALLMNPIGLIITGIAVGAYLIYRYWTPIKAFFAALWEDVKSAFTSAWNAIKSAVAPIWQTIKDAFAGGIGGITKLIVNWSPLGLFYKAFAGVMSCFGIDLPKNFTEFGSNIISGLVGGITSKLAAARDAVVNFGSSIKGWFTSTLGIKSPSTVFMGFGDNIGQGLEIGMANMLPKIQGAASKLAGVAVAGAAAVGTPAFAADVQNATQALPRAASSMMAAAPGAAAGGMSVTFAPNITIGGENAAAVKGQVQQAMQMSVRELEQMLRRVQAEKARRAF